jgi:hypothetical protein
MPVLSTTPPLPGATLVNQVNTKFDTLDAELDTLAPTADPTFTGIPHVPLTPTAADQAVPKTYVDSQIDVLEADVDGKAPINNPSFTGTVTLPGDPTIPLAAATKQYVDALTSAGLTVMTEVVAGTTANITLSGAQTIDGVSVTAGQRVLVKTQTAPAENGIYVVAAGAWSRATDMDSWAEVPGAYTFVRTGTTLASTGWVAQAATSGTLGSTAISWVQFSAAPVLPVTEMVYETRTALVAASVPAAANWVRTLGYTSVGDLGGATYERVGSEPSHAGKVQSADGAWWELRDRIISPEMLGAVGNGSTNDTTAISNWHAVCAALRKPGNATPDATYLLTSAVSIASSDIDIDWKGAIVEGSSASNDVTFLRYVSTALLGSVTLTGNSAKRSTTVTVNSAALLAVGRYLLFDFGFVAGTQSHIGKIIELSGTTVTLEKPLPFAVATTDSYNIFVAEALTGVTVKNLTIDGTAATGTGINGVTFSLLDSTCLVENVRVRNFTTTGSGGFNAQYCYGSVFNRISSTNSGTSGAAAIWVYHCTGMRWNEMRSEFDHGFGIEILAGSYLYFNDPGVIGSDGRGFKYGV